MERLSVDVLRAGSLFRPVDDIVYFPNILKQLKRSGINRLADLILVSPECLERVGLSSLEVEKIQTRLFKESRFEIGTYSAVKNGHRCQKMRRNWEDLLVYITILNGPLSKKSEKLICEAFFNKPDLEAISANNNFFLTTYEGGVLCVP